MFPARALSSSSSSTSPALMLRHCVSASRTGNVKLASSLLSSNRHFSQMRKLGSPSPKQWNSSNPSGGLRGQVSGMSPLASMKLPPTSFSSSPNVFSQRAGATRALSLWPFGSGSGSKQPPSAVDPTIAAEATSASPSTLSSSPMPANAAQASPPVTPTPDAAAATTGLPGSTPESNFSSFVPDSLDELGIHNLLDMPEHIGYLKELGLDFGWGPTAVCQWLIEHLHVTAGLPWWGSIAAAALLIRIIMIWPTMLGAKYNGRMQQVSKDPEFIQAQDEFKFALSQKDQASVMKHRATMLRIQRAAGTSTLKAMVPPLIMVPLSYGMFRLLRAMAALPVPSLETGGIAWFTDLSVYDPTYVLPIATSVLTVLMLKYQQKSVVNKTAQSEQIQQFFLWVMTPFMFLVTMWLPSALQWFFLTFSALSVVQNWVLVLPSVRAMNGLPPLQTKPAVLTSSQLQRLGMAYQAPSRPTPQPPSPAGVKGVLEGASKKIQGVGDGITNAIKDYSGGEKTLSRRKAAEYEERRAREEKEKALRRLEERRRRKQQA